MISLSLRDTCILTVESSSKQVQFLLRDTRPIAIWITDSKSGRSKGWLEQGQIRIRPPFSRGEPVPPQELNIKVMQALRMGAFG